MTRALVETFAGRTSPEKVARPAMKRSPAADPCVNPLAPCSNIMALQRTAGNRAVRRLMQSVAQRASAFNEGMLQRESAGGDWVGVSDHRIAGRRKQVAGRCRAAGQTNCSKLPSVVHEVPQAAGNPLDPATRSLMESRFGHDLSQVKVHTDARAAEAAQAVSARAYTVGHNVVFGKNQYAPETLAGKRLLAHELVHVIQNLPAATLLKPTNGGGGGQQPLKREEAFQRRGAQPQNGSGHDGQLDGRRTGCGQAESNAANVPAPLADPESAAEREADHLAEQVLAGHSVAGRIQEPSGPFIQRRLLVNPEDPELDQLQAALERLTGRTVNIGDGQIALGGAGSRPGGSATISGFITRAIDAQRIYRLRSGPTRPDGSPVLGAATDTNGDEVVITVNLAHTGALTWTLDELISDQITGAVARFETPAAAAPGTGAPAPETETGASTSTGGQAALDPASWSEDMLLTGRLPFGSTDATPQAEIESLQQAMQSRPKMARVNAIVVARFPQFSHEERARVLADILSADGVSLAAILRGVETNTPYPIEQRIENGRVSIVYADPRRPAEGHRRPVTFVPGATGLAAGPFPLPRTGERCNFSATEMNAALGTAVNSCCTDDMLAEIDGHVRTARTYAQRAIARMGAGARMDSALQRHFGPQATQQRDAILANLRQVFEELDLSRHGWVCRPRNHPQLGCPTGRGGTTVVNEHIVRLCGFYGVPGFTNWTTVLHEIVHAAGVGTLAMNRESYLQAGERPYPPPTSEALRNADSYTQLVRQVGAGQWQEETAAVRLTPTILTQAGLALGGEGGAQPVLGARLELTALGEGLSVVDFTTGLTFLWLPQFGVVPPGGGPERDVTDRFYAGAEAGARINLTQSPAVFVDVTGGAGAFWPGGTAAPDFAATLRGTLGLRYGTPSAGFTAGIDLQGLLNTAETARGGLVIGLGIGGYFGGPEEDRE